MRIALKVVAIIPLAAILAMSVVLLIPLYGVSAVLARIAGVSLRAL